MADEHNGAIKRKREMTDMEVDEERNTRHAATSPSLQDPALTSYEAPLPTSVAPDLSQIDQQLLQHVGENAPHNGTVTVDNDLATKAALAAQQHQQEQQQQQQPRGPEPEQVQRQEQEQQQQQQQQQESIQQQQQQQEPHQEPQPPLQLHPQPQQSQPQPQPQPPSQPQSLPQQQLKQQEPQQQQQQQQQQHQHPQHQHQHQHQHQNQHIGPEQVSSDQSRDPHAPQSLIPEHAESKYPPPDSSSFHNEAASAALAHGLAFADEIQQLSQPGGPLGPAHGPVHPPAGTTSQQQHTDPQHQHHIILPAHPHSPHGNTASALIAAREAHSPKPSVGSTEWHSIRKLNHKEVERRRREAINEGINEIAKLVPGGEKAKGPILQRAIAYLLRLQSENKEISARWEASNAVRVQAINHLSNDIHKLRDEANRRGDVTRKWISRCRDAGMVFDDFEEDEKSVGPIGIGVEEDQSSTAAQAAQAAAAAVAAAAQVNQQNQAQQHPEMPGRSTVFNTESS